MLSLFFFSLFLSEKVECHLVSEPHVTLNFLSIFFPLTEITSLVLFFCNISVVSKHSVPVTEGAFLFGCVAGFPLLLLWPMLFSAAKSLPSLQTFSVEIKATFRCYNDFLWLYLWVTVVPVCIRDARKDGVAWSISDACPGRGMGKQFAEVCWLHLSRSTLLSESIADLSYFVPFQHFRVLSPSFLTLKQLLNQCRRMHRGAWQGGRGPRHTGVFCSSCNLEHNYS